MPQTIYLNHLHALAVIHGVRNFPDRHRAAHFARRFLPDWVGPWFVLDARVTRNIEPMHFRMRVIVIR